MILNGNTHDHKFNVKITEINNGTYIAQLIEIPGIIIQSDNKENIRDQITIAVDKYFRTFPEEHERIIKMATGVKEVLDRITFEQMIITA